MREKERKLSIKALIPSPLPSFSSCLLLLFLLPFLLPLLPCFYLLPSWEREDMRREKALNTLNKL